MKDARPVVIAVTWFLLAVGLALLGLGVASTAAGGRPVIIAYIAGAVVVFWALVLVVILVNDPTRRAPRPAGRGGVITAHTLEFTVGDREKHRISYLWDQMWGWSIVSVDGRLTIRQLVMFGVRRSRQLRFRVGDTEQHDIRIEKRRPLVAAFARPQPLSAYCDGALVAENPGVT
jgi:hypothetical protein